MYYTLTQTEMRAIEQGDERTMFKLATTFLKEERLNIGTYFLRLAASKQYQPAIEQLAASHDQLKNWGWTEKLKQYKADS